MRSFLLVLLLLLAPALYLYSAENPTSPQRQTNLPANQSLGDDPSVTVGPPSLQHRAEQGDVEAQYLLAFKYEYGLGVPQDYDEARKWYLKAAEQGYAPAQYKLGVLYSQGHGVPQDYDEARKWYLKAAEQGYAPAQYKLGVLYSQGHGVPQDYVEARKWWLKVPSRATRCPNHPWYSLLHGRRRPAGLRGGAEVAESCRAGPTPSPIRPWSSLRQGSRRPAGLRGGAEMVAESCRAGRRRAQYALGLLYFNGDGVPQDYVEARKWWLKAAQGHASALYNVGSFYHSGKGVRRIT